MKIAPRASSSDNARKVLQAQHASVGVQYLTCGTPCIRVRYMGLNTKHEAMLDAWDPNYQEWRRVNTPPTYKLQTLKEGEYMPTVKSVKAKPTKNSVKAMGAVTGKSVYTTWGIMFAKHGKADEAAKLIAEGMATNFPGRKTNWMKWVNSVRTLYNRGDVRLGTPKPSEPLKPYINARPAVVKKKKPTTAATPVA